MTATTIRVQMAQRKDTAANWTAANPILLSGEIGYETDTKKFKIGDGTTNWNSLAYLPIPDGSGNLTITGNLEIGSTGSLTFEGSTADGFETTLAVTNPTADRTITLPDRSGTVITSGDTGTVTSTMLADGTIVDGDVSATAEIAVSKLANGTANQVIVTDGTNVSWSDNLTLAGDLTVNGTTTTINTQDLLVEDKNIIIGNVDTPTDVTADGGGITLKGTTDKTINWVDATDAWTSSERFSIPLGSAAAPSLTFAGDPNTGIYSPGADQVAISTNGTGRLFVDANGNIGAGVSAPQRNLHVAANVFGANLTGGIRLGDAGNNYYLDQLITTDGSSNPYVDLKFATHTLSRYAYGGGNNYWEFYTNNSPAMRLDSSGRLGLGTSSPAALWHLRSDANSAVTHLYLQNRNAGASAQSRIAFTDSANDLSDNRHAYIGAVTTGAGQNGNSFVIATNPNGGSAQERVWVSSTGNVGIGTTSPATTLSVNGGFAITSGTFPSSGSGLESWFDGTTVFIQGYNRTGSSWLPVGINGSQLVFGASGSEAFRVDSSRRLLVGTSSDSGGALLQVNGDRVRIATAKTPASASATGTAGEICWDANYVYVCTATNTWKRSAISTW